MLRRIPSTSLVCLVVCLVTSFLNASWAADPDKSLEILLKPNQAGPAAGPTVHTPKYRSKSTYRGPAAYRPYPYTPPPGITKVKRRYTACAGLYPCILPTPRPRQWELSAQAFFARTKGTVAWPRYSPYYTWYQGYNNEADLNSQLQLPEHDVLVDLGARYQFRCNWAVKYQALFDEMAGGGYPDQQFTFGPYGAGGGWLITYGQEINSKWTHSYQRVMLVYDAVRTPQSVISIGAGWAHVDERIELWCTYCGYYTKIFSKSMDPVITEIQFQRCLRTAPNGGTLSFDNKVAFLFNDDVEGYDVQLGGRFSVPLGCGRWGFAKGGYRFVQLQKSQSEYLFKSAFEGGFIEGGLIF